ncbi:MAG: hypothetical protein HY244_17245 [Rhizobiales bacterium]|nr:hypothetical protein [Hyphomicrobiales bacterium]
MKSILARLGIAALCALSLSGCISSVSPILSDSQPLFGERARFQLYGMRKGIAVDPEQVSYTWDGARYAHAGGGMKDVRAFSVHPFEAGDFIVQSVPANRAGKVEYAVMHRLMDGVYQVLVIDEADADEPTRAANCNKGEKNNWSCRIETREQLFAFARATAAHRKDDNGGLAIRLPSGGDKLKRR